jgi:serine/threonine-protein kinase
LLRRSRERSWKGSFVVEPDTIIDGRYKVISRVGSGGMADVYLAEDQLLGRQVAVKLLHHHFAEDQEFVERFRREASSAAGLSHQNIVGIFDRGEWQGTYYIAMEYVAGRSLKTTVREQGALDPVLAIDIVVQILRAARFAHRRGVIHRDLKPHNVIIDEEGRARVTDFGIARAGASDMTLTGSIMGTAQYLSPEQAQGHVVSGASDLYSIGVILYELLSGVVPFEGETAVAIAFKQVSAEPRPPSAVNPAVPPALDAIVLRALAKDPAQRYADADEFIAALQRERERLSASPGAAVLTGPSAGHQASSAAAAAAAGAAGAAAAAGGQPPRAGSPPTTPQPIDASHPTGALLLPAADGYDEDPGHSQDGDSRRRRWLIAGAAVVLIAAGVALALVLGSSGTRVSVPDVIGQTEQVASVRLRAVGLTPVPSQTVSATVPSGQVVSEAPPQGSRVESGTRVSIAVSSGPGSAALPSVEGSTAAQAASRLRAAGFKPSTRTQPSAEVAQGRVIGTDPSAGTELQVGSPVAVLVSSGPAQVRAPDVTGDSQSGAEAALTTVGLTVGTVAQQVSATETAGNVLSQSPSAGTSVRTGTKVNLTVAMTSNEVAVPKVVGQSETQAAAALGGAGFAAPSIRTVRTTEQSKVGVVLKQSPTAGRLARKGSTVTLTVGILGTETTTTPTTTTPTTTTTTTTTTATPPPAAATPAPAAAG